MSIQCQLSIQTFHKSTSEHYEIHLTKRILSKRLKQWIVGTGLYLYYAFVYSDPQRIHSHSTSCSPSNCEGLFRLQTGRQIDRFQLVI